MAFLPSPAVNGIHIGPAFIHVYALMYLVGITAAIMITRRRWRAAGGDPALAGDVALWAVPAGIIGGRIYFDLTTPADIPHHWWGVFAVWSGGLGIWGAVALAAVAGAWRVRRRGADVKLFMDAVAPALLVAQAIGRIGNYFNQELFGRPTSLPWGCGRLRPRRASRPVSRHARPASARLNWRRADPTALIIAVLAVNQGVRSLAARRPPAPACPVNQGLVWPGDAFSVGDSVP